MWWLVWHVFTMVAAFVWLLGGAIGPRLFYGEALAAAVTLGSVGAAWLTYLTSIAFGALSLSSIAAATAVLVWVTVRRWDAAAAEHRAMFARGARRDDVLAAAVVLCLGAALWPTYSGRMVPTRDGKVWTGGSCYGDLPIHMTIAQSFLVGCNTAVGWPSAMESPIFAGHPLTYPFLPDWHAAVLVRLGGTMRDGFFLPGFLLASALWALLFYFTLRVTRSRLGGVVAVALVVFAGGLGGPRWLASKAEADPAGGWAGALDAALREDVVQHDPTGEWKYLWFAFVPHIMLPQRGANFAYPAAVLVLDLVWMATDAGTRLHQGHRRAMLVTAAALAASLPLVQAHSFIGLALIIGVFGALDFHKWLADAHLFWSWVMAGVVAVALAYPQMAGFTDTVSKGFKGKFLTFGWLFNNYEFGEPHGSPVGLLRFWVYNLGPVVPLFLLAILAAVAEMAAARRLSRAIVADDGPSGLGRYLASVAATDAGATVGEPNPLPPAPKSATGATRPLPATVLPCARAAGLDTLDGVFAPMNALSPTGRAWDTLKLALGGVLVFLVSNYVNFQPWDRDNAKIYYVFVFVAAPLVGGLLAAPVEYLTTSWTAAPGRHRIPRWFGATTTLAVDGVAGAAAAARGASPWPRRAATACAHVGRLAFLPALLAATASGAMMLAAEYRDAVGGGGVLLDGDSVGLARYVGTKVHPRAVVMHSNWHVQPSGALAGRPSFVAYYGWVSNHGYNADERLGDRDYVLDHVYSQSDARASGILRKWGIRYVLVEHGREPEAPAGAQPGVFLDGGVVRVHTAGRYDLLQVQGYTSPPA
jgi:hypothetical protein